jgi:hypothetical protein
MSETSERSSRTTSRTGSVTSSRGSVGGAARSGSLESQMTQASGLDPALASRLARLAGRQGWKILGIYGQSGIGSSKSAALQSSLASRLVAQLDSRGSTLFRLTWKLRGTPLGRLICALRASVPRTSGSGSILSHWPTTTKEDAHSSARHGYMIQGNPGTTLLDAARLAGWATPVATELGNTVENYVAMKKNMTSGPRTAITHPSLQAQLVVHGNVRTGYCAETGGGARLNPAHSRWLMGLPRAWDDCAPTATRLSRSSRRRSSEQR